MNMEKEQKETEIVIDWKYLLKVLLRKAWLIIVVGVVCAAVAFVHTAFFVTPLYASNAMLLVDNANGSDNGVAEEPGKITAADLSAAQSLVDTYMAVLHTRTTMEMVAEKCGLGYTSDQLLSMVSSEKSEGTEMFTVSVRCANAEHAAIIAGAVSVVLPERISEMGIGSISVADEAVVNENKVYPNVQSTVIKAAVISCLIAAAIIVLIAFFDDTIHGEDYITSTYDIPLLSKIPDLSQTKSRKSGYYKYYKYAYYGKEKHHEETKVQEEKK